MPRLSKIGAAALAAFGWTSGVSTVSATYLVVAGGGAGGNGGGGAGGYRTGTASLDPTLSYTITVGAGGANATYPTVGSSGGASSISSIGISSAGGGAAAQAGNAGLSGGSGGGGAGSSFGSGAAGSGNTPSTSPSQGNNGGTAGTGTTGSSGGGGASAVGGNGSGGTGGAGGAGTASSISGSSVTYSGGGGAGGDTAGAGGSGGGGAGASGNNNGTSGTSNTGGGGGGTRNNTIIATAGNGGSGIVIISYAGAQQFSGGVVTSVGGNTIHTFNTSGTLGPITPLSANYLVVAGGGAGGGNVGGGGGAGGLLSGSGLTIDPSSTYLVTVGAGGASVTGANGGNSGTSSSFSMVSTTAVGGGGGSARTGGANTGGATGGSGGGGAGGSSGSLAGFAGTSGQGNTGGTGQNASTFSGGGGGGAGAVGSNATVSSGGNGGVGVSSSISGTATYYAGGGGGGANSGSTSAGSGGLGGGGSGTKTSTDATAGTANTGGGGGGAGDGSSSQIGAAGGSGIVIISYAGATQLMAGGTVTITGGNVIHTFTSTGFLAPLDFVGNSLRFRSSASAYLNRTLTTPTNNKIWTWSGWVKRGQLSSIQRLFFATGADSLFFEAGDTLAFYVNSATTGEYHTTQVFRDPAAWYHLVLAVDTTQATNTNRVKLYVNGSQITAFSGTLTYVTQNHNTYINSAVSHALGAFGVPASQHYFDGYMTEVNFIDGQALTPNSFGTFNSYGVWQPITYGGSYGTNGFYLPFNSQTQNYVGVFNGTNQYLSAPSNSAFAFGTGDFTVECFAYFTSVANFPTLTDSRATTSSTAGFNLGLSTAKVQLYTTSQLAIGATTLVANRWYHIAVTRSGTTLNIWVNGFKDATITNSTNWSDTTFLIGATPTPTNYMTGSISNLRVVKGTAVYTSDFTPATSALTNISGTSLLTLQNATIIDNSTNAFTITNNNTVTTGQTYPFSYAIFNDRSPQGNNWTPNNISGASGTTLDYMTDVPTLTSATAANYCTLNPLANGGTLSGGNLNATSGTNSVIYSTFALTDKIYWEVTLNGSATQQLGIADFSKTNTTNSAPGDAGRNGYIYLTTGGIYNNGSLVLGSLSTATTNDVICFAYDSANNKLWIRKNNGTWFGGGDPATGSTPSATTSSSFTYSPVLGAGGGSDAVNASANFGQRPFTYTAPSGYVALNTFNM